MTAMVEQAGCPVDLQKVESKTSDEVVAEREEALAKQLAEQRRKKAKLVNPLQYEMSIAAEDLSGYIPSSLGRWPPPQTSRRRRSRSTASMLPRSPTPARHRNCSTE